MFGGMGCKLDSEFGLPRTGGDPGFFLTGKKCKFAFLIFLLSSPIIGGITTEPGTGSLMQPKELKGIDVVDKSGTRLPLDIQLKDHQGRDVVLGDYFTKADARPVILTMGYYECPMLCSLVLNGLVESLNDEKFGFSIGEDYRILSVSIDPNETVSLANTKRENYLKSLKNDRVGMNDAPWSFHVGEASEVKRLAGAVGFSYNYIEKAKQYAHGAAVWVISPEGMISRTHYGIAYKPRDLKLSLMDASAGRIGSVLERVLLSCLHYDPDSNTYGLYVFGVMRLGALLTVLALAGFMALYFSREKRAGTLA